jgi:hypothetical protein
MDSTVRSRSKERYVFKLEVNRKKKNNTVSTVLYDTIPAGLSLIPGTLTTISGIDSLRVNGNAITAYVSGSGDAAQIRYAVEVTDPETDPSMVQHYFTVQKRQSNGKVVENKLMPVEFEIRSRK